MVLRPPQLHDCVITRISIGLTGLAHMLSGYSLVNIICVGKYDVK
jgi:hypothetical protein